MAKGKMPKGLATFIANRNKKNGLAPTIAPLAGKKVPLRNMPLKKKVKN